MTPLKKSNIPDLLIVKVNAQAKKNGCAFSLTFQHLLISPSSRMFPHGQVPAIGAAVGVPDGGRAVAVRSALFSERTSVVR